MTDDEAAARQRLIDVCLRSNALGINQGTSGNASCRWEAGMLITPTATPYDELEVDDIVYIDADGLATGTRAPSSEWRFHYDILRTRREFDAVIHLHSPAATALSTLRRAMPPFHYMVAVAGGTDIRCARYATYGTAALSEHALEALADRRACLLANHGQIACARTPNRALELAIEVEALADQYLRALSVAEPVLLTDAEMAEVLAKFGGYRPE